MSEVVHNHLTQERRDPGECPACDVAWERQRERLAAGAGALKAATQIEQAFKAKAQLDG